MNKSKSIQIRFDETDYKTIKLAFRNENISQIVRQFLLSSANERLESSNDMSLQEDVELNKFMSLLSHPDVQKTLFNIFKKAKEV